MRVEFADGGARGSRDRFGERRDLPYDRERVVGEGRGLGDVERPGVAARAVQPGGEDGVCLLYTS
ncbi:hypothetical protein, partial [Streptomyces sp. wa1071]|uniref:hypothetical protein n=1 Tax=Streptomyces sp. wa1071 TaxID=1828217 RepID=UPI00211DA36A